MWFARSGDTNGLLNELNRGSGSNAGHETKRGSVTAQQQLDGVLWAGLEVRAVINIIHHGDLGGKTLGFLSSWTTGSLSIVHCESEPNPVTPDKNKRYHKQDHVPLTR